MARTVLAIITLSAKFEEILVRDLKKTYHAVDNVLNNIYWSKLKLVPGSTPDALQMNEVIRISEAQVSSACNACTRSGKLITLNLRITSFV